MQPVYYETNSLLHRLNPLSKLIAIVPLLVLLDVSNKIGTLLLMTLLNVMLLLLLGKIPLLRFVKGIAPFFVMLIGFLLFYPLFVSSSVVAGSPILLSIGIVQVCVAGVLFGLVTSLRIFAVLVVMQLFLMTTEASDCIRALVQQWHINYRFGYSLMAAYRFIPLVQNEWDIIRAAHKIRGLTDGKGICTHYQRFVRTALPLLTSAIRGAERKALAMDARAFGAFATRTYYRRLRFSLRDGLFVLAYWLVCIGILILSNQSFIL